MTALHTTKPSKELHVAGWIATVLLTFFLLKLGGLILGDLPGVTQTLQQSAFRDQPAFAAATASLEAARERERQAERELQTARDAVRVIWEAKQHETETFEASIKSRMATGASAQDAALLRHNATLDSLAAMHTRADAASRVAYTHAGDVHETVTAALEAQQTLEREATDRWTAAKKRLELKVFLIRLAFTLPLLLLGAWIFVRRRTSTYWPLWRAGVTLSVWSFFVELVPYLPSYGGYVRYIVGIIITIVGGRYGLQAIQALLLAREAAAKARAENPESAAVALSKNYLNALTSIQLNRCPHCENALGSASRDTCLFCLHCGLNILKACADCGEMKNAFEPYCMKCGAKSAPSASPASEYAAAAPTPAPTADPHN